MPDIKTLEDAAGVARDARDPMLCPDCHHWLGRGTDCCCACHDVADELDVATLREGLRTLDDLPQSHSAARAVVLEALETVVRDALVRDRAVGFAPTEAGLFAIAGVRRLLRDGSDGA